MRRPCSWKTGLSGSLLWMMRWNLSWRTTRFGWTTRKRVLHNKCVYWLKAENNGTKRYKAMMVVNVFQQREGFDFTEVFSHVVKLTSIDLFWALWQQRTCIWNSWILKLCFSMVIWRRTSIWCSHMVLSCRERSIWFASSRRVSMTWNRLWGSGIWSSIDSWLVANSQGCRLIIVVISSDLRILISYY